MTLERCDNGGEFFATIPDIAQFSPETTSSGRDHGYDHDIYSNNPRYQDLSSELRNLLFATAQSACPSRAATPNLDADVAASLAAASAYRKRPQLEIRQVGPNQYKGWNSTWIPAWLSLDPVICGGARLISGWIPEVGFQSRARASYASTCQTTNTFVIFKTIRVDCTLFH